MKPSTVHQLNTINTHFYEIVGQSFDETRQQPWEGWQHVVEIVKTQYTDQSAVSILDVGCGNGRFGEYIQSQLTTHTISYVGIDSNQFLLDQAQTKLPTAHFYHKDIIEEDIKLDMHSFDVIVLFGVLHHVPSQEIRKKLLLQLTKVLNPDGLCVATAWQFDTQRNLFERSKEIASTIDIKELEEGDYLLDWRRDTNAVRYCHLYSEQELTELFDSVHLTKVLSYLADGKNHKSNLYVIGQKNG